MTVNTAQSQRQWRGRLALISAPWPLFSRPSIQLGTLKAYLQAVEPGLQVDGHHFFLRLAAALGYPVYRLLSRETWVAESVYAALLYPERAGQIACFFQRQLPKDQAPAALDFAALVQQVKTVSEAFLEETDWTALDLVGFSVCLCQLTASFYFMREIRRRAPEVPLIAGGSIIGGYAAADLLAAFPEIDLIVTGEGELPLTRIVRHLRAGGECCDLPPTAGIVGREVGVSEEPKPFWQLANLQSLPVPDFSDYFALLQSFPAEKQFFPTLPMEMSRGCWWRAAGAEEPYVPAARRSRGCAFCNLNLQWRRYRSKGAGQVLREIQTLTDQYRLLSVAFMDNALPTRISREVFAELARQGKDLYGFAELRATTGSYSLETLRSGGLQEVQIGIEALSTRLLRKINKGTTAIDNLEIMKHCEGLGLKNTANLILHFPGSDESDVAETLNVLPFARFFRPLRIVHFWLGMQSPVWQQPRQYGLQAVYNHSYYKYLFPEHICRRTRFMIQDYRGDKTVQRRLWRPVAQAVKKWRKEYEQLHVRPFSGPILTAHDGGNFLILRERRIGEEPVNHRLEGSSRKIYLFCHHRRKFAEIRDRFPAFAADQLQSFLSMMVGKKLLFEENGQYLSLAVPVVRARFSLNTGPAPEGLSDAV